MSSPMVLAPFAGRWIGHNTLIMHPEQPAFESATTVELVSILDGKFVRLEQVWAFEEKPQYGSMLIGAKGGKASIGWADTLHTGRGVMAFSGTSTDAGEIDVRGSYPAPEGPDWGWRIQILPAGDSLQVVMWNITPDGEASLAVKAVLTRET